METKKYVPKKEQSKTPERELSNEEIANLSDGEFKTLVIKMLTDLIELGWKMKKNKWKIPQNEIKQNIQGTNSDTKETRTQINDLEKKGRNKNPTGTEWRNKNSKKRGGAEEPLGHFQKYQHPDHMGARVEEEEQEIENLFEQIMKENFPNLAKEIDFQEAQRVPKKLDPKKNTPRHITIKLSKIKRQRENPKSNKGKGDSYLQRSSHKAIADFSKETLQERRGWNEVFEVMKDKTYIPDYSIQQSFHLEWKGK